jgi:glutamine amidotransferase
VSDGDRLWGFRYASDGAARTLFFSSPVPDLRKRYPDNPVFQRVGDESRLVVSEPLGDVAGVWRMVPEASYGIVQDGPDLLRPFTPTPPKRQAKKRKPAAAGATT